MNTYFYLRFKNVSLISTITGLGTVVAEMFGSCYMSPLLLHVPLVAGSEMLVENLTLGQESREGCKPRLRVKLKKTIFQKSANFMILPQKWQIETTFIDFSIKFYVRKSIF